MLPPAALCSRASHRCAPLQAMSRGLQTMSEGGSRWNVARRRVMSRSAPAASAAWDASGQAPPISRYETTYPNSAGQDPVLANKLHPSVLLHCTTLLRSHIFLVVASSEPL